MQFFLEGYNASGCPFALQGEAEETIPPLTRPKETVIVTTTVSLTLRNT